MSTKRPSVSTLSELIQKYQGSDWDKVEGIEPRIAAIEEIIKDIPSVLSLVELVPEIESLLENPSGTFVNAPLLDNPVDYTSEGFPAEDTLGAIIAALALLSKLNEAEIAAIDAPLIAASTAEGTVYDPLGGNFPPNFDNVDKVLDSLKKTFPQSGRVLLKDVATQGAPLSYPTPFDVLDLTNDGNTNDFSQAVLGREIFWNFSTQEFDFNSFNIGDILTLRIDIDVLTSIANQEIKLQLNLAEGSLTEGEIEIDISRYPLIENQRIIKEITFVIDRADIINSPGHIQLESDAISTNIQINSFELFYQVKDEA
jgi:hypothetical protein